MTDNYTAVGPTEISDVKIQRKQITPDVTLSEYTYLYDSGYKEPKVTVKDGELKTVLPETEYQFEYVNNRNVSTPDHPAKVVVTDKAGGNYDLAEVEVPFQITLRTQESLSITEKPNTSPTGTSLSWARPAARATALSLGRSSRLTARTWRRWTRADRSPSLAMERPR